MKTKTDNVAPLVHAAQTAGASETSQDFWKQVEAHLEAKDTHRAQLVKPRPLTSAPKLPTV
jgi:hypothetical protein